jgi:hypothetical protein
MNDALQFSFLLILSALSAGIIAEWAAKKTNSGWFGIILGLSIGTRAIYHLIKGLLL